MSRRRMAGRAADSVDALLRRFTRRSVVVYLRNAMHAAVLDPVVRVLEHDPRVRVRFAAETTDKRQHIDRATGRVRRWVSLRRVGWMRIDLFLSADPWNSPAMRRAYRRMNFFHGVAGKYDLDNPGHLPTGFDRYDRVAFINVDRMRRYVDGGIVRPDAAVLVGYPKIDALVNGRYDAAAVRARFGLEMHRRTAIYAPTWSPASSLHLAGEAIVEDLVGAGFNVLIKPHDLSFDPAPKYSGGIDWRKRLRGVERPGRVVLCEQADVSPLLAASDVMITDHSTVAFEFFLLDRPVIVFDAPDLPRVARINPERIALLRSAATVVREASDVGTSCLEALAHPHRGAARRAAVTRDMFYDPGNATERALGVVYELLDIPVFHVRPAHQRAAAAFPS